jgi:serine/threonine protein kinase
MLNEI